MLSIYLSKMDDAIYHPPTYFDNRYEDEWITAPLSVEMIKDVDRSEVISAHLIESPVLGYISTRMFNASVCDDNCAKWILQIGMSKDLTVNLRYTWILERTGLKRRFSGK